MTAVAKVPVTPPPTYIWLRSWPSGHVHAVSTFSIGEGSPSTRCGICWPGKVWTGVYPPLCRTCPECERRVGPRVSGPTGGNR